MRNPFLIEAISLCLVGGFIGIALGIAVAVAIAELSNWPIFISPTAVLFAFVFAGAVGIFFGSTPPRRLQTWTRSKRCTLSDWPPTNTVRFLVPTWIETLPSQPDDRMRLTELGIATFSEQGINDSPRSFEIQIVNPDSAKQMLHRDNGRTIAGRALQRQDFVIAYAGVHLTASEQVAPLGGGF